MEKIEEKIKECIKDYVQERVEHCIEHEMSFLEEFDIKKESIGEIINQEYDWDINGIEEELAYDIGYVRGLRDAIEIMEREEKDNATI